MNVPQRKPRDAAKIRKEHLANLALESSNNQLNMNASLMLKNTGRSSLVPDQNTATDKYSNEEGKKQLVRDFLSGNNIMTTFNAEEVIQRLSPAQIQFFDQYKEFIKKDFKGKRVPVEVFVNYLMKLQRKEAETQGVEYNLQQVSGSGIKLQLTSEWCNEAERQALQEAISRTTMTNIQRSMLESNIHDLDANMLTPQQAAKVDVFEPNLRRECQELASDILNDYPTSGAIISALRAGDIIGAIDMTRLTSAIIDAAHHLQKLVNENEPEPVERPSPSPPRAEPAEEFEEHGYVDPPFDKPWGETSPSVASTAATEGESWFGGSSSSTATAPLFRPNPKLQVPYTAFKQMEEREKDRILDSLPDAIFEAMFQANGERPINTLRNETEKDDWYRKGEIAWKRAGGKGIKGSGLSKRKTPAERSAGYEKPKPYRQFGRYLVHAPKLEEGVLMIKTPAGAKIKELPSQHITPELKKVLRVMAKGDQPSFAHCQGLGVEDQAKLHHIIRHSQFGMELPDRDEDKEINQFEIMKGEIEAGNDNRELIKKFKQMLIRFTREGRSPRRECNQVLEELLHLGH